ncbi:uncharacterized [Tachysurus ichikawai]
MTTTTTTTTSSSKECWGGHEMKSCKKTDTSLHNVIWGVTIVTIVLGLEIKQITKSGDATTAFRQVDLITSVLLLLPVVFVIIISSFLLFLLLREISSPTNTMTGYGKTCQNSA